MSRFSTALLLILATAACGTGTASPSASSPPAEPAPSQDAPEPSGPSAVPEPSVSPSASVPAIPAGHPAEGLALVRFLGPDNPASQVFVVETDGTLRQVTGHSGTLPGATYPAWSPDRSQIAFGGPKVGSIGINGQIAVVNADGSEERWVTAGGRARWSPDGTRILFEEVDDVTNDPHSMYVVDVATSEVTDLGVGFDPRWAPDGDRISYMAPVELDGGGITSALYIRSLSSGEITEIGQETEGFWSPDGSAMLLVHDGTVSLAGSDGSGPRPLADGFAPVWSPDGSRVLLAYDHDQDATPILAVVDLEGREIWSGVSGSTPVWSPDGTRIAVEIPYPQPSIQVLDASSGEVLWEAEGMQPAW